MILDDPQIFLHHVDFDRRLVVFVKVSQDLIDAQNAHNFDDLQAARLLSEGEERLIASDVSLSLLRRLNPQLPSPTAVDSCQSSAGLLNREFARFFGSAVRTRTSYPLVHSGEITPLFSVNRSCGVVVCNPVRPYSGLV
jgi:hypothetical protein